MTDEPNQTATINDWNNYWQGSADGAAFSSGGVSHPAFPAFWSSFFGTGQWSEPMRMIDVACGTGAVAEAARQAGKNLQASFCLDTSQAAIDTLEKRYPEMQGLVASATSIPLANGSVDIATSQFGVEYAGLDAINEMARLVAPNGSIAMIMHCHNSEIHFEAAAANSAIQELKDSAFIPDAVKMFAVGFAAAKGDIDQTEFRDAVKAFTPTFKSLEPIMDRYGVDVAGDTICELYNEVAQIQNQIHNYDEQEVMTWLNQMDQALDAYQGRMTSMMAAALAEHDFYAVCESLRGQGFELVQAEQMFAPATDGEFNSSPLAWVINARKQ